MGVASRPVYLLRCYPPARVSNVKVALAAGLVPVRVPKARPSFEAVETALRKRLEYLLVQAVKQGEPVPEEPIRDLAKIVVGLFLQTHFQNHPLERIRVVTAESFNRCLDWLAEYEEDE